MINIMTNVYPRYTKRIPTFLRVKRWLYADCSFLEVGIRRIPAYTLDYSPDLRLNSLTFFNTYL